MDSKTPLELYNYMIENITYGFISKDKKRYVRKELNNDELYETTLFNNYYLQTPEELEVSKCGICYDQVEFMRKWFINHGYEVFTFYINYHNHAFLMYKDNSSYNIIECTVKKIRGIYTYNSFNEALLDYKNKQIDDNGSEELKYYKYDKVSFGCDFDTFLYNAKKNGEYKI